MLVHFKIIETTENYPDVLVYRDRDEDGQEIVKIFACGILQEEENMFVSEEIVFQHYVTACVFIKNFGLEAAVSWCKRNEVSFW